MLVPDAYRPQHPTWALDLVRRHPLALLVTTGADGPLATHLPAIPDADSLANGAGETGLTGTTFLGHMNRRNPQWSALRDGSPGLMVFYGPESYVSPAVYGTSPASPTWNFTSVHLHGTVERVADSDKMDVLKATVHTYERDHGTGWDPSGEYGYFDQLAPGVGAFRFAVTAAEAMFKLSQDKPIAIRTKVLESFAADPSSRTQQVANVMRRCDRHVSGASG